MMFPFKDRLFDVKKSLSRIKRVLWERWIAYQQATYLINRESKRLELQNLGKSAKEIDQMLYVEFPKEYDQVGRKKRFKLQGRYKGEYKKPAKDERWFIE
jgi:hypothetical protein